MIHSQGSLGLTALLLALSCISTVNARCFEDTFGNVNCTPVISPGVAFGISIAIFIVLLIVFLSLARQRRNRIRSANLLYVHSAQTQPQHQAYPQQGFPASPYVPPYAPPYQPPYGPPPGHNAELNQKNNALYDSNVNAPQYPPPSYIAA